MAEIRIDSYVVAKLDYLTKILFEKEYFSYLETAENYVNVIYDFINTIPTQQLRFCKNKKYGKYYATLIMNDKTNYYITFDFQNEYYLIRNIFNNHEEGYPKYIL